MRPRRLAALILSAAAVAGCGSKTTLLHTSSSSSSSSTTTQAPATTTTATPTTTTAPSGTVKSADGQFATVIPNGFVNALSRVQASPINIQYLAVGPRHDGFATNINVVHEPSHGQTSIDTITNLEIAGIKRLEPQAHQFSQVQSLTVDGQPARAIDYLSMPDKRRLLHQYQVFVTKSGTIYTITYSALPSTYSDNLASVKQVTDGWHWLS
ncbi:MAG: hypothetical protein ACXVUE_23175 [Solirubrobacteraceae bacterium]